MREDRICQPVGSEGGGVVLLGVHTGALGRLLNRQYFEPKVWVLDFVGRLSGQQETKGVSKASLLV